MMKAAFRGPLLDLQLSRKLGATAGQRISQIELRFSQNSFLKWRYLKKLPKKWAHSLAPVCIHSFTWFEKEKQFCVLRAIFLCPLSIAFHEKRRFAWKTPPPFFYCVADMEIWILLVCVSTTTIKMCKGGRKCGTVLFLQSTIRLSDLSSHEPDWK